MATTIPNGVAQKVTISVPQAEGEDKLVEVEIPALNTGYREPTLPKGYREIEIPGMPGRKAVVPEAVQVAFGNDGKLYHCVPRTGEALGSTPKMAWRRLAMTKQESLESKMDFYDPVLGLVWEGYKVARDRSPQDIMNDNSMGLPKPGELTVDQVGIAPDAEPAVSG